MTNDDDWDEVRCVIVYFIFCFTEKYEHNENFQMSDLMYHQQNWNPRQYPKQQFKCVKSGLYPDPRDCRLYYECMRVGNQRHQMKTYVRKCDHGKIFSYKYGTCTKPSKSGRVECGGSSRQNRPGNRLVSDTLDKTSLIEEQRETKISNKAGTSQISNVLEFKHSKS